MPSVSVLIPAFKTKYLAQALTSARQQTYADLEILVGDDTADGKARPIVEAHAQQDARVQYIHHGFGDGLKNSFALWHKAKGRYVKWLYDDDVLMPTSVEQLVWALRQQPGSVLAFHQRVVIDGNSQIIQTPALLVPKGQLATFDRQFLVEKLLERCLNFIGEPSNILLDRELLGPIEDAHCYQGRHLLFLSDLAVYLNCAARGPVALVGAHLSAFRQHDDQVSNAGSPILSAGCFEWELLARGEVSSGTVDPSQLPRIAQAIKALYCDKTRRYPELAPLLEGLSELQQAPPDPLSSPAFLANLDNAYASVAERFRGWRRAREAPKSCAVCEQSIDGWLPHPDIAAWKAMDFLIEVESVGSTLENHLCPRCHCNDRDRHVWLYMSRVGLLDDMASKRVLHIAPEATLEPKLVRLHPAEYVAGDLQPRQAHHQKLNVESLQFPDGSFDLIICNHVLEHVDRPETTLAELSRCLAPNGRLVAQTPYSPVMKSTLELTKPASEVFKTRYYGQADHVRLFGADVLSYFKRAGLDGDLYPHDTLLHEVDPDVAGVNGREPFFLFWKGSPPILRR